MITPRSNRGITHSTMVRDLTPITEVNITEEKEDDVPVMNLSKVFARRNLLRKNAMIREKGIKQKERRRGRKNKPKKERGEIRKEAKNKNYIQIIFFIFFCYDV